MAERIIDQQTARVGRLVGSGAPPPVAKSAVPGRRVSNVRALKAIIFGDDSPKKAEVAGSMAMESDPVYVGLAGSGRIVEPPFDPLVLSMLPEHSTELNQCIEALVTNVHGFGYTLVPRMKSDDVADPEITAKAKEEMRAEYVRAFNFLENCGIRESLLSIRKMIGTNLYTNGNSFLEIIRSPSVKDKIDSIRHLRVHEMRLCKLDDEFTVVPIPRIELQEDGSYEIRSIDTPVRFRRYVQIVDGKCRFFKEFGDPRLIDCRDGYPVTKENLAEFDKRFAASEVYHFRCESDRTPYGLPALVGNLLTIFGDRAADEINFVTLRNNNVPSMVLMCSGGQASKATLSRIKDFSDAVAAGENYSRFLLVEAEGAGIEGADTSAVKFEFKPLIDVQTRDSMFQEYQKNNARKIRSLFRLPPIFLGLLEGYNRATADIAKKITDEQVFAPARRQFDEFVNGEFFARMGIRYWKFESLGPTITDIQDLLQLLSVAERTGGMTPKLAMEIIGRILGKDIGTPKSINPDEPFSMQMAEKVKNQAPMGVATQVTALKDAGGVEMLIDQMMGVVKSEIRSALDQLVSEAKA